MRTQQQNSTALDDKNLHVTRMAQAIGAGHEDHVFETALGVQGEDNACAANQWQPPCGSQAEGGPGSHDVLFAQFL